MKGQQQLILITIIMSNYNLIDALINKINMLYYCWTSHLSWTAVQLMMLDITLLVTGSTATATTSVMTLNFMFAYQSITIIQIYNCINSAVICFVVKHHEAFYLELTNGFVSVYH